MVSNSILPNTYHISLIYFNEHSKTMTVQGSKTSNKTYIIEQEDFMRSVDTIFTFVLYNN